MIDAAQIRAARALLNIGQTDLARIASVHVATIRRLEAATEVRGAAETVWKIQKALEAAGVEFIPEEAGRGAGVRFRQAKQSALAKPDRSTELAKRTQLLRHNIRIAVRGAQCLCAAQSPSRVQLGGSPNAR